MKKICFFSGDITRSGGTERVAAIVINELVKKEYNMIVLSLVEQKKTTFFSLSDKVKRYTLGDRWLNPGPAYLPVIPKLKKFVIREKVDVLVDIDTVLDVLSVPVSKMTGVKIISWEHFNHKFEMSVLYRKLIISTFTKYADYLITLTHSDNEIFCRKFRRSDRIVCIHNPMLAPEKVEYGRNIQKNIVTAVRLEKVKGVEYLLDVANRVLTRHPDWKWYVLGEGKKRKFMEKQIAQLGLKGSFILEGNVENVDEYLAKADIFVLTSKREGLPMCLLEAKAYGIPSVSFDIETGPAEIIMSGINGFLIPPFDCKRMADKIEELMDNADLRQYFSVNAWKNREEFELEDIICEWEKVLAEVNRV